MWPALLLCQLATLHLSQSFSHVCISHPTFREPVNTDIDVLCGTERVELQILLCPVYYNEYNESLMALNAQHFKEECKGTPDWTADPPVLKFNFSIREEAIAACLNKLMITQEVGTGLFSDFSHVQFINISGMINSLDTDTGTITYRKEMTYKFSCRYPLQYLVNSTEMSTSGTKITIKDNNGSFISTLSMQLYADSSYTSMLQIPAGGLQLKTRIFVQVKATNLTNRFNVLLDRCYATTTPFPVNSAYYDLFVGCNRDGQTVIGVNGLQQEARFSFEAFRFIQHQNRTLSTFFLHCATRLCEHTFCSSLVQNCTTHINYNSNTRRRRSADGAQSTTVSSMATVSSGPINTRVDNGYPVESEVAQQTRSSGTLLGIAVVAGIIGAICITLVACIAYLIYNSSEAFNKSALYQQE
ncbi:zona pellucida-like domain-containing protein 1 [Lampris incognitus]|uniref:zona pellucida-like domain-containing protein 1 n=1 Tax=Lampris incognitus TaxID=2546036 RepID=UPI0024B55D97|nr:zona pellucida-like domain-containing protein 1 [Lampris incognitus]